MNVHAINSILIMVFKLKQKLLNFFLFKTFTVYKTTFYFLINLNHKELFNYTKRIICYALKIIGFIQFILIVDVHSIKNNLNQFSS